MKKLIVIVIALGAITLSSCTRVYYCDCDVGCENGWYSWEAEYNKKSDAKNDCEVLEEEIQSIEAGASCELTW